MLVRHSPLIQYGPKGSKWTDVSRMTSDSNPDHRCFYSNLLRLEVHESCTVIINNLWISLTKFTGIGELINSKEYWKPGAESRTTKTICYVGFPFLKRKREGDGLYGGKGSTGLTQRDTLGYERRPGPTSS